MAGLPPKPDDALPPRPPRGGTSPRAASMRSDRDRDRDRDDWRRRSPGPRRYSPPRSDTWRRPARDDDRYVDHPPRSGRDRDERERPRPRGGRDRGGGIDTYVPDSHPPSRRRSPPQIRRRPSHSRSPAPRRSNRTIPSPSPYHRSPSPYSHSPSPRRHHGRSQSPRRRSLSRSRKVSSREPYNPRSTRSPSPRSNNLKRDPDPIRNENHSEDKFLRSKRRATSEFGNEDTEPARSPDKGSSLDVSTETSVVIELPPQTDEITKAYTDSQETALSKRLPKHPPPSGPRRPRTPTGPRVRSPAHGRRESLEDLALRRENKGKGKEVSRDDDLMVNVPRRDRSASPPRGPRKRTRWSSRSRSESRSQSPRSPCSRSRSRHSASQSPARSHSQQTVSEQANSRGSRKDHNDKPGRKLPNIDDLILPLPPRESRTSAQDGELKRVREQRAKLEVEHAEVMRAVRRAQHEFDLAVMELRSAEERRKAAERVHERTVKGFLAPVI